MPHAVSQRQYRLMQAIMHGYHSTEGRGTPPKEVAAKYTESTKDVKGLPDQHGSNTGGNWNHASHSKHHKRESEKHGGKKSAKGREHRKKAAHHAKMHRKKLKI